MWDAEAHTPVNYDDLGSSEADPKETRETTPEEVTPQPKGTKKRGDLREDETDISTDNGSDSFKTPRTLKERHSGMASTAYSAASESETSGVESSEVGAWRQDKEKESRKDPAKSVKATHSKKVRTYYSLATVSAACQLRVSCDSCGRPLPRVPSRSFVSAPCDFLMLLSVTDFHAHGFRYLPPFPGLPASLPNSPRLTTRTQRQLNLKATKSKSVFYCYCSS